MNIIAIWSKNGKKDHRIGQKAKKIASDSDGTSNTQIAT